MVQTRMNFQADASGELEEGELSTSGGNESDDGVVVPSNKKVRKLERFGSKVPQGSHFKEREASSRRQYYEPTPPRGYRTPAGQRLRDRWKKRSPTHNLKFKYHGTMDLIKKSSDSYPSFPQWRPPQGPHVPSPSRKPDRPENIPLGVRGNLKENSRDRNSNSLADLNLKKPLQKLSKSLKTMRPPPSPDGDVEDLDYIDLLLEYKQIQKQLEHLSKEEAGTVTEVEDKETTKKPETTEHPDSCVAAQKTEVENTVNDDDEVTPSASQEKSEKEGSGTRDDKDEEKDCKEPLTAEPVIEIEEDEAQRLLEEEELNELRLAALASASKGVSASGSEKGPNEDKKPQPGKSSKDRRGSSRTDSAKRSKEAAHRENNLPAKRKRIQEEDRDKTLRRNQEDDRDKTLRRNQEDDRDKTLRRNQEDDRDKTLRRNRDDRDWRSYGDRMRRERDDYVRRDRDERRERRGRDVRSDRRSESSERRSRQGSEAESHKQDDRPFGLARVLTLDSHQEQVDRFVQILQDRGSQGSTERSFPVQARILDSYDQQVENFVRKMQGDQMLATRASPRNRSAGSEFWNRLLEDNKVGTRDNYDEVEMDLGSEPASPVPDFEEMDQEVAMNGIPRFPLEFPLEFPHPLPYDTEFLLHTGQQLHMESNQMGIGPMFVPSALHLAATLPPPPPPPPPSTPPPPAPALPPLVPPPSPDVDIILPGDRVSSSAKSDTSEENQEPDEEDDVDEDLLRAELLYELAQKRRELIKSASASSLAVSADVSSKLDLSISRTDSSHSLQLMPLVEPVVITIGNESSDESDNESARSSSRKVAVGLDGQLDLFLAMQRQTVEEKMKLRNEQATSSPSRRDTQSSDAVGRAQELESHLRKVRASLVQDDSRLSAVRSQLNKRKRALATAELKAAKLREQLAAADRIIAVTKDQTERLNIEAGRLQTRISSSYTQVEELERQTLVAGKAAYGEAYNLGIQLQPLASTQPNKTQVPNNKLSMTAREKLAEDITREKTRLKEREQEVAVKLKSLKEAQAKARARKKNAVKVKEKSKRKATKSVSEHIHTTPVMSFNFGPEVEKEMTVITAKRRRSLADLSPSTTPNLPDLPQELPTLDLGKKIDRESSSSPKPKINLVMPSGKQLASLNKMLGVSKMPASARHTDLTVKYRFGSDVTLSTSQLNLVPGNKSARHSANTHCGLQKYQSPLQMFQAYRLSPYFRTKSKNSLTSETYSNKLDHQRLLCHYDLHGKCQDEKCSWQHRCNYQLSKSETMMDIAAHLPSIAGLKPKANPVEIQKKLEEYVTDFQKKNSQFSHDQQCLLLLSEVISKAQKKLPHMIINDARKWRPTQPREDTPSTVGESKLQWSSKGSLDFTTNTDDVLLDGDIRYWMLGSSEVQDMETAVLESPNSINLWINLANKKLHNPKQSHDKNIDSCLNVLSRGLELNRTSSDLWLYYLKIYNQRSNNSEMLHLCEQALKYAPTYHLHCKYLNFLEKYQEREEHCDVVLKWLTGETQLSEEQRSHWILETLLYKVALATNCGRFRNALKALQQVVLGSTSQQDWSQELLGKLTSQDTSLLWLSYIHLVEFRFLPPSLFDPANAHKSTIVSKEPFLFPWEMGSPTRNSAEYLESRFKEAIEIMKTKADGNKLSDYEWHIHRNWIFMEVISKRLDNARNMCRQLLLEPSAKSVEIWLLLFRIEDSTGDIPQARKVVQEAQEKYPFSSCLVHNAAVFDLIQGDVDSALEKLEFGVVNMFDVSLDDKRADPNLLYCKCLSQPVPLMYDCPNMKDEVQTVDLPEQELYLWLNYWLLLVLHGDRSQASEVCELALGAHRLPEHIHMLWRRYIQYELYQLSQESASAKVTEGKLMDLLYRSLLSLPSKSEVPLQPGLYWLNYTGHNDLIDLVLGCLPDHCLTPFLEKLIVWMPNNVVLIQRACEHFIKEGNRAAARGISMTALQHHPACLSLWKIHMAQVQREGSYSEVKKLYRRALKHINLTLSLWKDLLVYEMVCGNRKSVVEVITQCEDKGLNIHDFLASISGNGEARPASLIRPKTAKAPPAKS